MDRDSYALFYKSVLSAKVDNFFNDDGESYPAEKVGELRTTLEKRANIFLKRVYLNEPTEYDIAMLRRRNAPPIVKSEGTTVLSDDFRRDVLVRLRGELKNYWGVDVGSVV